MTFVSNTISKLLNKFSNDFGNPFKLLINPIIVYDNNNDFSLININDESI